MLGDAVTAGLSDAAAGGEQEEAVYNGYAFHAPDIGEFVSATAHWKPDEGSAPCGRYVEPVGLFAPSVAVNALIALRPRCCATRTAPGFLWSIPAAVRVSIPMTTHSSTALA